MNFEWELIFRVGVLGGFITLKYIDPGYIRKANRRSGPNTNRFPNNFSQLLHLNSLLFLTSGLSCIESKNTLSIGPLLSF